MVNVSSILTTITKWLRILNDNMNMIYDIDKQFFYHDVQINITKNNSDKFYRVELKDRYNDITVVYEKSFNDIVEYAREYYEDTENRKKLHDIETKCIGEMIKIDEERGTRLCLD